MERREEEEEEEGGEREREREEVTFAQPITAVFLTYGVTSCKLSTTGGRRYSEKRRVSERERKRERKRESRPRR